MMAAWLLARTAPVIALGTAFRRLICADRPCARAQNRSGQEQRAAFTGFATA